MIQLTFPSTIEAQTGNVTFLTIKSVVGKIQKNDGQTGSCALTRQCLDRGCWGYWWGSKGHQQWSRKKTRTFLKD